MQDRLVPCIYYTYAHGVCQKGFQDVTLAKCKNCKKYKPRKTNHRPEGIKVKRRKDIERHDNWRDRD